MKLRKLLFIMAICVIGTSLSCKQFVEIEPPKNSLIPATVFKNNDLATSAVLGIYQQMATTGFASGNDRSMPTVCGLTADELVGYNLALKPIFDSQIIPEEPINTGIWSDLYQRIYDANAALEGLQSGNEISPSVKTQLQGEAHFCRAFGYFYLVNLYGEIPLPLSSDYLSNSNIRKTPVNDVYNQIIADLEIAESLLTDGYISTGRVRPNKDTARALLARTYLYIGDWKNAERYAAMLIEKTSRYSLTNLDQIFLSNSQETIWQLVPPVGSNTPSGNLFILTTAPTFVSLRPDFALNAFEANDLRKSAWVKSIVASGTTYYYPFKYKVRSSATVTEYTMVFRFAEQFLIRAEARAWQNNLLGAIDDLDKIRNRAGLGLIKNTNPTISQQGLLNAIQKERRIELFAEWGHRWFDLKRTGKADAVLALAKPNWKPHFVLFPIPYIEVSRNLKVNQNGGY